MKPRFAAALLVSLIAFGPAGGAALAPRDAWSGRVRIQPTATWVGIARVYLEVGEMQLHDGVLEGDYEIRIPLRPSQNDSGKIRLEAPLSIDEIRRGGVVLSGHADSAENGKRHQVNCTVQEDGRVRIRVTTDERILSFRSRYDT